jgi:hypothetical protein
MIYTQIASYLHVVMHMLLLLLLIIKWKDIKDIVVSMLSETTSGGGISSKRCIAVSGMATLCYLCIYCGKHNQKVDANVLIALCVIVLTSAAIATFPQILDLFGSIKNIGKSDTTKTDKPDSNVSIQVNQQ